MITSSSVVHRVAKPISTIEFRDALLSTCPPRFPSAHHARPQRVVLAISGGVDSMALAFLFNSVVKTYRGLKIADNPIHGAPFSCIIDHRMRPGSEIEANNVANELRKFGGRPIIKTILWKDERAKGIDYAKLPNVESLARTRRYQQLGRACYHCNSSSLFFAHHRDDQYETILMRLLAGHGYRGLRGMQPANAIPECYNMSGVYKSGILDDQQRANPSLSFKPTNKELYKLRKLFQREQQQQDQTWETLHSYLTKVQSTSLFPGHMFRDVDPGIPYLRPLNIEDGGINVYRPLLEFDKDRLIATCEANNIRWFEDATNADPTLTTRNALRHLIKNHRLPVALQKPAILKLGKRSNHRVQMEETEAKRIILREGVIRSFDSNVGTLRVRLPSLDIGRSRHRKSSVSKNDILNKKQRVLAAVVLRKLIDFVTPDQHAPPISNLDNVVRRLYPRLFDNPMSTKKAFSIAGVLLEPLPNSRWLLSCAPHATNKPQPSHQLPVYHKTSAAPSVPPPSTLTSNNSQLRHVNWRTCRHHHMWDNRFWIRLATTLPSASFQVGLYHPSYSKPFVRALPPEVRKRLEKLLKVYAPGKIRFSLPALYAVERTKGGGWAEDGKTLLALPTLGVQVPGLERWVRCDVRYRHVDMELLQRQPKVAVFIKERSSMRLPLNRLRRREMRRKIDGE